MTRPDVPEALEDRYWNGHAADCLRRGGLDHPPKQYPCSCGFVAVLAATPAPAAESDPDQRVIHSEALSGPCPGGCGCNLYSPDADPADCGCDSYCTMDTTDWPKWHADAAAEPAVTEALRRRILDAIRRFTEPAKTGTGGLDFDNPQGIHVDEAEDIPAFLDSITATLAASPQSPEPTASPGENR